MGSNISFLPATNQDSINRNDSQITVNTLTSGGLSSSNISSHVKKLLFLNKFKPCTDSILIDFDLEFTNFF